MKTIDKVYIYTKLTHMFRLINLLDVSHQSVVVAIHENVQLKLVV